MTAFERVGFIGLGGMGRGLVKNLVAKGVAVIAYDLNPAAVEVARSFGATAAGNLQQIRDCRIIMICVNEAEDVEALLTRTDGLLAGPAPGFIIVDHTTGSGSPGRTERPTTGMTGGIPDRPGKPVAAVGAIL